MALVKFDDAHHSNLPIYINPDHVVFVQTISGQTWIATTARSANGGTRIFITDEHERDVVLRLGGTPGGD